MDSHPISRHIPPLPTVLIDAITMTRAPVDLSSAADLIGALARGSEPALKRLYELQSRRLYGIALRIVHRPEVANDVLQDAFVQIWRNAAGFDPGHGTAEAWLAGIVRFRAIDAVRKTRREELSDDPRSATAPTLPTRPKPLISKQQAPRCDAVWRISIQASASASY
jgi:RNA polymerase sigma factor (sigma-70 family)